MCLVVPEPSSIERDDAAVGRFIERLALELTTAGLARMPARVLAGLLTTDSGSLTAGELADLLRVSPASISEAVRYLMQLGMVAREREPGSRRDHYVLLEDLWSEITKRRNELLIRWQEAMEQGMDILGAETPAGIRMAEAVAFFDLLYRELEVVLKKWPDLQAALLKDHRG
jgi:DNA-binding transcriptional regulator GbsR (MarR family)